jgi:hypothetical protein
MENEEVKDIYREIRNMSKALIHQGDEWRIRIKSAKNYVCVPDMKQWTFGKSTGEVYHADGGIAKKWLYNKGFINILSFPDGSLKKDVIKSFFDWAEKVKCFDIKTKFEKDQENNKRFELLVHKSLLKKSQNRITIQNENQDAFDDGFRKIIIREVNYTIRNRKVVELAKKEHGTECIVCGFDFGKVYGFHGDGFIEVHHLFPIANGKRETTVKDLRPVCANCHRMLHRGATLLSIKKLQEIIKQNCPNWFTNNKCN